MARFPIEPLGDLVFVKRIEEYSGPVTLVDSVHRDRKSCRGVVRAAGPGRPLPDGSAAPMQVRAGDIVCFAVATGIESSLCGEDILVMHENDVLAVVGGR